MRSRLVLAPLLLLGGCSGCQADDPTDLLAPLDAWTPEGVEVGAVVGGGLEVQVPVRIVNRYLAPVPGGEVEVSVLGPTARLATGLLEPDLHGHADASVHTDAPEAFSISVISGPAGTRTGATATSWSTGGPLDLAGTRPVTGLADLEGIQAVEALTGGFLLVLETTLWVLPASPDQPPWRVLATDAPLQAARPVHLDGDGVLDVVAWTGSEVYLLRGRPRGGLGWAGGFGAQGRTIHGVGTGDVDGDQVVDLVAALSDLDGTWFDFRFHDGAWGFSEGPRFFLDHGVTDTVLADSDQDARAELAVLDAAAQVDRYRPRADGDWLETSPSALETALGGPATFLGVADLDGGGADDLLTISDGEAGVERSVVFLVMEDGGTRYRRNYEDPWATVGDLTGDGLPDLAVLDGGTLDVVWYRPEGEPDTGDTGALPEAGFRQAGITGFPTGPLTVADATGDGVADVAVVDGGLVLHPGEAGASPWQHGDGPWYGYAYGLLTAPHAFDDDDDGIADRLLAVAEPEGVPEVVAWEVIPQTGGAPAFRELGALALPAGGLLLDEARCGGDWYLLVDDGGTTTLFRIQAGGGSGPAETARAAMAGERVACGSFAGGATVAVGSTSGTATFLDGALAVLGTEEVGALEDLAAADPDGDGLDELVTCPAAGCALLAADLDGDGLDEVVQAGASRLAVTGLEAWDQEGGGRPSIGDLDGDGVLEVMATTGDRAWVHRLVDGGLVPAVGIATSSRLGAAIQAADLEGDGVEDLLAVTEDGTLRILLRR